MVSNSVGLFNQGLMPSVCTNEVPNGGAKPKIRNGLENQ